MTDDKFKRVARFTMAQEGGAKTSNHSNDPGGLTKYGISQRAFPGTDIEALTEAAALELYRAEYWTRIRGDALPAPVDLAVFDYAFNSGVAHAVEALQVLLGVKNDGYIGPKTLEVLATKNPFALASDLLAKRLQFLGNLAGWRTFGLGWARRLLALQAEIVKAEIAAR